MEEFDIEIVRVRRWQWIESTLLGTGRNPRKPSRGNPLEIEAECRRCGKRWIAKSSRSPDARGRFALTLGTVRINCLSCDASAEIPEAIAYGE